MRFPAILVQALVICLGCAAPAVAQNPPPPIGPYVVDLRGSLPSFSQDTALAASRGLSVSEMPGRGLGLDVGAHLYPFSFGRVTIGLGGQLTFGRSDSSPNPPLRSVTSHYTEWAPQLSLNFGSGDGWSYLSGGAGKSRWSIVPDGDSPQDADESWVWTFDYGGGARWFARSRVAFIIDIRVHAINAGPPQATLPGTPQVRMLILSAGVALR